MCGGGSGREPESWGRSHRTETRGDRDAALYLSKRADSKLSPERNVCARAPDQGGSCRTLAPKPALLCGSEIPLSPSSSSTSGCVHVPPVVSHFEPVSNGGPRTDLPPEECVLLLIHPTGSQLLRSCKRGKDGGAEGSPGPGGGESRAGSGSGEASV